MQARLDFQPSLMKVAQHTEITSTFAESPRYWPEQPAQLVQKEFIRVSRHRVRIRRDLPAYAQTSRGSRHAEIRHRTRVAGRRRPVTRRSEKHFQEVLWRAEQPWAQR